MAEAARGDGRETDSWTGRAAPVTFTGWSFIALLIFTQVPGVFAFTIPLPLLAGMARELAHDPTGAYLAKMVSGVLGPSMAIGAASGGWLADKFDRRWLLIAIGTLYVVSGIAPTVLSHLGLIVALRFGTGFGAGALMAIGMTMVGDYLPEQKRAGTIGMLSAVSMVASVVTVPASGLVGDHGWRTSFLLYLLAAPVILLASLRALPIPNKSAVDRIVSGRPRRWLAGLPWELLLLACAAGIILTIPGIYMSFHLAAIGLRKTSTVGGLVMLNSLAAVVSASVFGKAWRRSARAVFAFGFGTMTIGLMLFAIATGSAMVIPAMLVMGAGMGFLAPCVMARAADIIEEGRRGQGIGVLQGLSSIAPLFVLPILEPLTPDIGTKGILLIICAISAGSFVSFTLARGGKPALAPS